MMKFRSFDEKKIVLTIYNTAGSIYLSIFYISFLRLDSSGYTDDKNASLKLPGNFLFSLNPLFVNKEAQHESKKFHAVCLKIQITQMFI